MQELSDRSQTGTLIRSVAEGFRLDIELNGTLATILWEKVKKYVTNTWYGYLADFVSECNERIEGNAQKRIDIIDNIELIPCFRESDCMIMHAFIKAGVHDEHLEILNIMRSSIKAVTLSDICTPQGRSITQQSWILSASNRLREDYDWPRTTNGFNNS